MATYPAPELTPPSPSPEATRHMITGPILRPVPRGARSIRRPEDTPERLPFQPEDDHPRPNAPNLMGAGSPDMEGGALVHFIDAFHDQTMPRRHLSIELVREFANYVENTMPATLAAESNWIRAVTPAYWYQIDELLTAYNEMHETAPGAA